MFTGPFQPFSIAQRAYSTTTRIKTLEALRIMLSAQLREHIPLQQGLRPPYPLLQGGLMHLREHIPLQQGLRREPHILHKFLTTLREHIPLQQGLRPVIISPVTLLVTSESIFHYNKD